MPKHIGDQNSKSLLIRYYCRPGQTASSILFIFLFINYYFWQNVIASRLLRPGATAPLAPSSLRHCHHLHVFSERTYKPNPRAWTGNYVALSPQMSFSLL